MKKIALLFLLLISPILFSQEGWFVQYSNDTAQLNNIFMFDSIIGWAVGPYLVLQTTNSGLNWQSKNVGINGTIDIFFIDPNTGWIVGYSYIIKTTNAGLNWSTPNYVSNSLYRTYFVDASTGFLIDYTNCWRTTNGGINWSSQYLLNVSFLSIDFANHDTGWIGGANGVLFKTTNCGLNWIQKNTGVDTRLYGLSFVSKDTGWAGGFNYTGDSKILFTSTSGESWIVNYIDPVGQGVENIFFTSAREGWATGLPGKIIHTTNAGISWDFQNSNVGNIHLFSGYFVTSKIGWIVGYAGTGNGKIIKTNTGGIVPVTIIESIIPKNFKLYQNCPNPFNPYSNIKFEISKLTQVKLIINDVLGKNIEILI
jgi:photosystem II stability/assembly factor-like uncharacterized protein